MPSQKTDAQLVVEGKHDKHVIWALCKRHDVEETFSVETPDEEDGGVTKLLSSIPVRLKIPRLRALGIVLDADQNIADRWEAVKSLLEASGYTVPDQPSRNGTIVTDLGKPKIGIWIMPNNYLPGMLEDFVASLIPAGDSLAPKVEEVLKTIEQEGLNRYRLIHHSKAFMHTWLAWQENPGLPMGQAITVHALNYDAHIAVSFVEWLRDVFVK